MKIGDKVKHRYHTDDPIFGVVTKLDNSLLYDGVYVETAGFANKQPSEYWCNAENLEVIT